MTEDTQESVLYTPDLAGSGQFGICAKCGLHPTPEGHDGCLGTLPEDEVMNACCGHGNDAQAYVQRWDGSDVRGTDAIAEIEKLKRGEANMNIDNFPKYRSHKVVRAVRIAAIEIHKDGSATIAPEERDLKPFNTRRGWAERFSGDESDPGVYVVYPDGFTSWSPTMSFDSGYEPIS